MMMQQGGFPAGQQQWSSLGAGAGVGGAAGASSPQMGSSNNANNNNNLVHNMNAAAAAALLRGGNVHQSAAVGAFNLIGLTGQMNMAALAAMGVGGGNAMLPTMFGAAAGNNANGINGQSNNMNLAAAAQAMNMSAAMQNFNLNDLKRLQQLQQFSQTNTSNIGVATNTSTYDAFQQQRPDRGIGASQQQQCQDINSNNLAALQSYLDQKIQSDRFGIGGVNNLPGQIQGQNPIQLVGQVNLLNDHLVSNQTGGEIGTGGVLNVGGMKNVCEAPLPSPHSLFHRDGSRRMRGGVIEPFPEKLHRLLLEVEAAGRGDVISFVANGRAFAIHKPDKFFKEIVPLYFRQSRLSSFKRQLNLYGFELINTGPARGGYYHELFVKDRPEMCRRMRRVAIKVIPKEVADPVKPEKLAAVSMVDKTTIEDETTEPQEQEDTDAATGGESHRVRNSTESNSPSPHVEETNVKKEGDDPNDVSSQNGPESDE